MPERICEISVGRNKCYAVEDNLFQYRIILSVTEGNLHDLNAFVLCFLCFCLPTVKLEVQLLHRLPPSLERSGKGGGRRWKPGIRVIRQYKIKKGDLCLPRINYFCIVYEV